MCFVIDDSLRYILINYLHTLLGKWFISNKQESCDQTCNRVGLICSEDVLKQHNREVDSCDELKILVASLTGINASNCNRNHKARADVPNFDGKTVYISSKGRSRRSYDCTKSPSQPSKRRLCFCHRKYHFTLS